MGKGSWLSASKGKADESSEPDRAQSPDPRHAATASGIRPAINILDYHQAFRVVSLLSCGFFQFLDRRPSRRSDSHLHLHGACLVGFYSTGILIRAGRSLSARLD